MTRSTCSTCEAIVGGGHGCHASRHDIPQEPQDLFRRSRMEFAGRLIGDGLLIDEL
jgi:hypothetical protein